MNEAISLHHNIQSMIVSKFHTLILDIIQCCIANRLRSSSIFKEIECDYLLPPNCDCYDVVDFGTSFLTCVYVRMTCLFPSGYNNFMEMSNYVSYMITRISSMRLVNKMWYNEIDSIIPLYRKNRMAFYKSIAKWERGRKDEKLEPTRKKKVYHIDIKYKEEIRKFELPEKCKMCHEIIERNKESLYYKKTNV